MSMFDERKIEMEAWERQNVSQRDRENERARGKERMREAQWKPKWHNEKYDVHNWKSRPFKWIRCVFMNIFDGFWKIAPFKSGWRYGFVLLILLFLQLIRSLFLKLSLSPSISFTFIPTRAHNDQLSRLVCSVELVLFIHKLYYTDDIFFSAVAVRCVFQCFNISSINLYCVLIYKAHT